MSVELGTYEQRSFELLLDAKRNMPPHQLASFLSGTVIFFLQEYISLIKPEMRAKHIIDIVGAAKEVAEKFEK